MTTGGGAIAVISMLVMSSALVGVEMVLLIAAPNSSVPMSTTSGSY